MRIKNWTKFSAKELFEIWVSLFENEREAIDTAVWIGNRLVKDKAKSTRRRFYSIKEEWMLQRRSYLTSGQKVREESLECRSCCGEGKRKEFGDDKAFSLIECNRCHGTGKYRTWWLYLHTFNIDGQEYSFHSYVKPHLLSDTPGEDKEDYGGRFTEEELNDLALPMTGLLKILGYVANKWGMVINKKNGTYISMTS